MSVSTSSDFSGGYARRHGCAWFEADAQGNRDPDKASGWWAVGGEDAQRFQSWRALPEKIVWWTNLTRPEAWSLARFSTFKEGSLFGPDWPALMTESGHGATDEAVAAAVKAWSETFARCAEWLSHWASVHDSSNPWDWGEGNLADALAPRMGWLPSEPEEPQPILQVAYAEGVDQEMPAHLLAGRRKVVLAFPRVEHARRLWNTRYPTGGWREISQWPRAKEERLAWLRAQDVPVLVRATIEAWRPGQETAGALWLGLRGRRFLAAELEPLWLTAEEAILLGTFAELNLDEGYVGKGWTKLAPPPGWAMASDDPLVALSWSQALLADAAWNLHQKGWTVLSFGQGQVTLLIDPAEEVTPLADAIVQAGLLMPSLVAKLAPVTAAADHQNMTQVDRWLKQTGGGALPLLDVDRLVAPWSGSAAAVRGVLEPAAQRLMKLAPLPNAAWATWWKSSLQQQARRSVDRLKARAQR